MDLNETKAGKLVIVTLSGKLDTVTSPEVQAQIQQIIDRGDHNLVIDFEKLDYISSAGLRVLIQVAKQIKKVQGKVALTALNPMVKKVFDMAGFSSWFALYSTTADAIAQWDVAS